MLHGSTIADMPLEGAWISCNVPVHFFAPKNSSYEMTKTDSETEEKLGNKFNATLRFKQNCANAEFSFRTIDGYSGTLEIFVSAVNNSGRCTQREAIRIAPLSSYRRTDSFDETRYYSNIFVKILNTELSNNKCKNFA